MSFTHSAIMRRLYALGMSKSDTEWVENLIQNKSKVSIIIITNLTNAADTVILEAIENGSKKTFNQCSIDEQFLLYIIC